MPKLSARFSFTINAGKDIDAEIIEFLNAFETPTERRLFILDAIRNEYVRMMTGESFETVSTVDERLAAFENQLGEILRSIEKLSRNGVALPPKSNSNSTDLSEAENALSQIWSEK